MSATGLGWPGDRSVHPALGWADLTVPSATVGQPAVEATAHTDLPDDVLGGADVPGDILPVASSSLPHPSPGATSDVASLHLPHHVAAPTAATDPGDVDEDASAVVSRETSTPPSPIVPPMASPNDSDRDPGASPAPVPSGGDNEIDRQTEAETDWQPETETDPRLVEHVGAPTTAEPAVTDAATRHDAVRLDVLPRPHRTRLITVANQKGGVGKTTSTVNVAAALALAGLTVLVIDLDPQGNASTALGIDHHADVASVYDVLVDGAALADVAWPVDGIEGLFCVPATIDLAGAEIELVSLVAREMRLKRALDALQGVRDEIGQRRYDYVFIDCPPSLGLLTVNALVAADEVFIPIQCEYYALEGLSQLLKNIDLVKSHLNPTLHVSAILLTMYDARTRLAAQVADNVRDHFPELVLPTTIPRSVRISEAPSYGQTVMTYDPGSTGALSYLDAARELAQQVLPAPTEMRETG